jgi:uncharacterized protein (TIGR03790 family)
VFLLLLCLLAAAGSLSGQTGANVLLVVNRKDETSGRIAEYYRPRRSIPIQNVCYLNTTADEEISWDTYQNDIERPVGDCLKTAGLQEKVLYIVTTMGVPLKVTGPGSGVTSEKASVDSELTLLYAKLKGTRVERAGGIPNGFFAKRDAPFRHPRFAMYLVTRLAANDFADVKAMIDHALAARNTGKFVIDMDSKDEHSGNDWLLTAAILLPENRVVLDQTPEVLYNQRDVIGYGAWGSNDRHRKRRWLGFQWLPGAIATEFVSSNARTVKRPPENWTFTSWQDREHWFGGSPQSLSADYLHEGATGASGNVYEPYLAGCVRPDYTLPAYFEGRNLAESFYLGMPFLSWQGVVFGDPLCSLGKPK